MVCIFSAPGSGTIQAVTRNLTRHSVRKAHTIGSLNHGNQLTWNWNQKPLLSFLFSLALPFSVLFLSLALSLLPERLLPRLWSVPLDLSSIYYTFADIIYKSTYIYTYICAPGCPVRGVLSRVYQVRTGTASAWTKPRHVSDTLKDDQEGFHDVTV